MPATTATFRFRHGAGRLCLDFTRTLRHRGRADAVDELTSPAAVAAWVSQFAPAPATAEQAAASSGDAAARRLREALFALVTAGPADRKLINEAAAVAPPAPTLGSDGRLRWHAADPVAAALSLVARDALDLVTSPLAERVRECADPDCGALFLDSSRPGSRRWCAMGSCGNRAKKGTYRDRHAAH